MFRFNEPAINATPQPTTPEPQPISQTGTSRIPTNVPPLVRKATNAIAISILVSTLIGLAGALVPMYFFLYPEYQRSQIMDNGVEATATVLSLTPTNVTINDIPQFKAQLRVQPKNGAEFTSSITVLLTPGMALRLVPTKTVTVRYLENDHAKVAIVEN